MMDANFSFRLPRKLHLCRLCLLHKESFVNIHEPNITHGFVIAVEISELLQLNVFPGDGLPEGICFDCLFDLSRFKRFKKISHEAEITLKYILNHNEANVCSTIQTGLITMKEENGNEIDFENSNTDCQVEDPMLESNIISTSVNERIQMNEDQMLGGQNSTESTAIEVLSEPTLNKIQIITGGKAKQSKCTKGNLEKSIAIPTESSQSQMGRKVGNLRKSIKIESVDQSSVVGKHISGNIISVGIDMVKTNDLKNCGIDDQPSATTDEIIAFNSQNLYKCSDCVAVFNDDYSFRSHLSSGLCTSSYVCSVCNESFLSSVCLMEHHVSYHTPVWNNESCQKEHVQDSGKLISDEKFSEEHCSPLKNDEICQKNYSKVYQASLSKDACHKSYTQDCDLNNQSLTLVMKRGFVCDKCGSCFRKKIIFEHHLMKYHAQKLSFNCGICRKTFLTKGGLKEHLVVHSTERPFLCDICGSAFKLRKKLLRHIRTCHSEK